MIQVLEKRGIPMADAQTELFDARDHEQPPEHRLTFLPRFGDSVRATCSCGKPFDEPTSDLMESAYKRHHSGPCSPR